MLGITYFARILRIHMIYRRKLLVAVFSAIGIGLLWWMLRRIDAVEIYGAIRQLRPWQFAAIAGFPFVTFLIAALRWRVIFSMQGGKIRPSFHQLVGFNFAGAFISTVAPSMSVTGDVTKAILAERAGVPRPYAFGSVFLDGFGRLVANTGFTFCLLVFIALKEPILFGGAGRALSALWILGVILIAGVFLRRLVSKKGRIAWFFSHLRPGGALDNRELLEFDELVSVSMRRLRIPIVSILISSAGYVWEIAQSWMILRFLGAETNLLQTIVWHTFTMVASMLPSPSGIGFSEAAGVAAAAFLGEAALIGLGFVLLGRIRDLVVIFVGVAVLIWVRVGKRP